MRKPTTAEVPALEMGLLRRLGGLELGARLTLVAGDVSIETQAMSDTLLQVTAGAVVQGIALTSSVDKCNRLRVRALCPQCHTRRRKLYLVGGLACRDCHKLHRPASVAQNRDRNGLALERLREKLQCGSKPIQLITRPKGMKRLYFQRWVARLRVVEPLAVEETRRFAKRLGVLWLFEGVLG